MRKHNLDTKMRKLRSDSTKGFSELIELSRDTKDSKDHLNLLKNFIKSREIDFKMSDMENDKFYQILK